MYLVPPKLHKKYLIGFWSPLELIVIAIALIAGSNGLIDGSMVGKAILSFAGTMALVTARLDLEVNLWRVLMIRLRYFRATKTYGQLPAPVSERRRKKKKHEQEAD